MIWTENTQYEELFYASALFLLAPLCNSKKVVKREGVKEDSKGRRSNKWASSYIQGWGEWTRKEPFPGPSWGLDLSEGDQAAPGKGRLPVVEKIDRHEQALEDMGCSWPRRVAEAKASHPVRPQPVVPSQAHLSVTVALPWWLLRLKPQSWALVPTPHVTWRRLPWFYTDCVVPRTVHRPCSPSSSKPRFPVTGTVVLSCTTLALWSSHWKASPYHFTGPVSLKCWMQFLYRKHSFLQLLSGIFKKNFLIFCSL